VANELTLTASLTGFKSSVMSSAIARSVTGLLRNMGGVVYVGPVGVSIGLAATAFPLAGVTQPHYAWFNNLDPTNYFTIRNGSGGTDLAQLFPGDIAIIPLLTTSVPFGVANVAAVEVEYMIFSL